MAARRRKNMVVQHRQLGTGKTDLLVVQQPAPVARRSGGGGIRRRRRRTRGYGRLTRGGSAGGVQNRLTKVLLGGFAYGILVKTFPDIPRIPGIGRSGTVALAVYLMKPSSQLLQDLGVAAAAIAGSSFGETGTVSGFGDDDLLRG